MISNLYDSVPDRLIVFYLQDVIYVISNGSNGIKNGKKNDNGIK